MTVEPCRPTPSVDDLLDRIAELEAAEEKARRANDVLLATTEALRHSEERYALAMRGPNEGLWDWNPITKELYLSARLLSILGFPDATIRTTSHEWLKLVHADDRAQYRAALIDHLKGLSDHFECEYRVRDRSGEWRWVLARGLAVRDDNNVAFRMVGSIGDITVLKQREAVLRASEARFRSLVRAAASVILVIDQGGIVREFNREAERTFDIPANAAIGCHWTSVLGTSERQFSGLIRQALDGGEVRDRETVLGVGTECRVLSWNLTPFDQGLVAVGQDVTRRIEAERVLQDANEVLEQRVAERTQQLTAEIEERLKAESASRAAQQQAEAASRCKSEFLANMSHELRTPLNAIIGFSDMMVSEVMGPMVNERYGEYAKAIHDSGRHLLNIINDILDLAKVEAGKFDLNPEPCNIAELIGQATRLLTERAEGLGICLKVSVSDGIGSARVDPLRIKQTLLNLLSNAIKFTPRGGTVAIEAWRESGFLIIRVIDDGIGMAPNEMRAALEPFVQVESALSRRNQGTGLGLPLAKKLVELHDGSFSLESTPGRGTMATLALPI